MRSSEQINELCTAMASAYAKIKPIAKDAANPFFKSKYADIAAIDSALRSALGEFGLGVMQSVETDETQIDKWVMVTRVYHSSGQWIASQVPYIIGSKNDPQGHGAAQTYARRYGLLAAFALATDDDDGNSISGGTVEPESSTTAGQDDDGARQMKSKHDGTCPICGGKINKGDHIAYKASNPQGKKAAHWDCYQAKTNPVAQDEAPPEAYEQRDENTGPIDDDLPFNE